MLHIDGNSPAQFVLDELGIMFDSWKITGQPHPWGTEVTPCPAWCTSKHRMGDNARCSAVIATMPMARNEFNSWTVRIEWCRKFGAWQTPTPSIAIEPSPGWLDPTEAAWIAEALDIARDVAVNGTSVHDVR